MIYDTPYNTKLGSTLALGNIEQSIKAEALRYNQVLDNQGAVSIKVNHNNYTIEVYPGSQIGKFEHPLKIKLGVNNYSAIDLTAFTRYDEQGGLVIRQHQAYQLQVIRNRLSAILMNSGGPKTLGLLPTDGIRAYADLLCDAIGKISNIYSEDYYMIKTYATWLYYSMLTEEESFGEYDIQALAVGLANKVGVSPKLFLQYLDGRVFKGLDDFVEAVVNTTDNPSLKTLNTSMIYMAYSNYLSANNLVGIDKKQLMAMSIEHIPTFIAILYSCMTEQSFKHAGLSKLVKNRNNKLFIQAIKGLVGTV